MINVNLFHCFFVDKLKLCCNENPLKLKESRKNYCKAIFSVEIKNFFDLF